MPLAKPRHPVWGAYQVLTRDLQMNHDEAMDKLAGTFVGLPVDVIVAAEGDLSRTLESITGQPPDLSSNHGRGDARLLRRQITEAALNGQRPTVDQRLDAIEQGLQGLRGQRQASGAGTNQSGTGQQEEQQTDPQDINAQIRARAQGNAGTLSHAALYGEPEQEAYDRSADPFGNLFDRRR